MIEGFLAMIGLFVFMALCMLILSVIWNARKYL